MKESTVEDYLVEQVEKHGAFCPKTVWLGRKGCPDREVVWPGGTIDKVETKRPRGGRYEAGQEQAHKEYAKRGVPVYLLRNKEAIDEYVRQRVLGYRAPALWSVPVSNAIRTCFCSNMDCARCYPELNRPGHEPGCDCMNCRPFTT